MNKIAWTAIAALMLCGMAAVAQTVPETPLIARIRIATLATPKLEKTVAWYKRWLQYDVAETGQIDMALAESWGAPKTAGRKFALLAPNGTKDVFVRVVAIDDVPGYRAESTMGWNSIEIIVDDLEALSRRMKAGGVEILREKAALGAPFASIEAMQIHGPAEEILNLSSETGDRQASNLPIPKSQVDRLFLISLAGPDLGALKDFYAGTFKMRTFPNFDGPMALAARAIGVPLDHVFPSTLVRAAQKGNTVEMHGYPPQAKIRPRPAGQLPPGVAIASFAVGSLDALKIKFITPPGTRSGVAYNGKRSGATLGPAGEIIELME